MDQFVYSLNGTVVVYGYDHFDGLAPSQRNDAVLLPKRITTSQSELDEMLENSFCTIPRITFDDLRTNFNDPEFDIADDEDKDDSLALASLPTDYYAKSDETIDDMTEKLSVPSERNGSTASGAYQRIHDGDNGASGHACQRYTLINMLLCFVFYNYRTQLM